MNPDEILAIVKAFLDAVKTVLAKIKAIFAGVAGGDATETDGE